MGYTIERRGRKTKYHAPHRLPDNVSIHHEIGLKSTRGVRVLDIVLSPQTKLFYNVKIQETFNWGKQYHN